MGFFKDEKKTEPEPIPKIERSHPTTAETVHKSVVGKTMRIKGEIIAEEEMFIEGTIEGAIQSSKLIVIGTQGNLKADLHAPVIKVAGRIVGNVYASTKIELESTAHIEGNISSPKLSVSESAYFKGNIDMSSKPETAPKFDKIPQISEEPPKKEEAKKTTK
ncbi:MAG: hypothetical protein A2Y62_17310 [Candidatus Fischerbacteria bacterium RBG_13_37_8]|uniref:Cell shape determination protein CcmA n=1 Tax=Candidatus Fischerbacteria bacterium RBG_13_37_8 TaxID=1817863 RepID=A0A1F5VG61_9BACT|nr:MAG: hypothetical protein A2Y62_17310 [Candidatus Fischerbacteria bacterium RBG_13_37_8]